MPLPLCLSSAVGWLYEHSCIARLSFKDVLWLLFGFQHAESQLFRGDSLQLLLKLLIFLPLPLPHPHLAWRHCPQFALLPCYVFGETGSMAASGTGQTTAVGFPYSRKNLKGNCTAGSIPTTAATSGTWWLGLPGFVTGMQSWLQWQ